MALPVPGIGSNLDVSGLITQLMAIERRPILMLDGKEAAYKARLSAFGTVKAAVAALREVMRELTSPSRFAAFKAASSDPAIVIAQAAASAAVGSHAIEVTALAQAQKLVAAGQADAAAAIGSGALTTLSFEFGTISGGTFDAATGTYSGANFTANQGRIRTVTIDDSNNTLIGIRDTINRAKIGVTATIVNDGSAAPYRLVLSADNAGKANSIRLTVNGDAAISGLLAHDPSGAQNLSETAMAQNAELKVDGVPVSRASNVIADVIPGVVLTLLKSNPDGAVKVNVTQDSASVISAVNAFAKAYNDFNKTLVEVSAYDGTLRQGAILNGDATVRALQSQVRAVLATVLTNVPEGYTTLSQIGVSFQKDGTLTVDAAKLQSAIEAKPDMIAPLFATTGTSSDSLVNYVSAGARTRPGTYAINITQLATRGRIIGSAPAALTINTGVNDTLEISLAGIRATVTLTAGTYSSAAELAAEVERKINGAAAYAAAGLAVTVVESRGVLTITASGYGSASGVEVTGGNGKADLLGAAPTVNAGLDVAGSINGVAATGAGQFLTGAAGDPSEGLRLLIAGGPTGDRGTVSFSRGYADRLEAVAGGFLSATGPLSGRTSSISKSIRDLNHQRELVERRLAEIERRYRAQFTALDALLSRLATTSNFLQQQLANLQNINT